MKENKGQESSRKNNNRPGFFTSITHMFSQLLLIAVIALAAYVLYEYRDGHREAYHDDSVHHVVVDAFDGQKNADGSYNILIVGTDSRGTDSGRADTLMIAKYDSKSKTPKIVSIMRDTYVEIPGNGWNKINASYALGGVELVRKTLRENFGIDIAYYAIASFESFPKIIDVLEPNGVEIDVEKDMVVDGKSLSKGKQLLTGEQVLLYARFRKDGESDFGRVRRQQQVMSALITQGLSKNNLFRLPRALGQAQGYVTTNIPIKVYPSIMKDVIFGKNQPLKKLAIPNPGEYVDQSFEGIGSVLKIDIPESKKKIEGFLQ